MYDPNSDLQNTTTIEKDGMTFTIERSDPPFFKIKTAFELPERYKGEYTTVAFAEKAINEYCEKTKEYYIEMMEEMAKHPKEVGERKPGEMNSFERQRKERIKKVA